jgi:hypothetical protein
MLRLQRQMARGQHVHWGLALSLGVYYARSLGAKAAVTLQVNSVCNWALVEAHWGVVVA